MNSRIDNYIRFFNDQKVEIEKDYNKTKVVPLKQLFREEKLTLAYLDSVNSENGHIIIKVKKGFSPRLKVMKNFTLLSKKAKEILGPIVTSEITFDQFNRSSDYHIGLSDILPMYFLKKNDPEYDYIGCSSVTLQMFSTIQSALNQGKSLTALIFDPFPPTEYYTNIAHFTKSYSEDPYLSVVPTISYEEWEPEELAYNPLNELEIVDTVFNNLTTNKCCIVQGPPGTGKSYTIAHIIARYLEEGKNVCVTTMANKGLVELAKQPPLNTYLKQGRVFKTRISADEAKQVPGLLGVDKSLLTPSGSLLLSTNYILSGLYNPKRDSSLSKPSFDLIVIEEASQAFLSSIVAFKQLGKDCLIVGDPLQLPPIVLGTEKIEYKLWNVQHQCDGLTTLALGTKIKSFKLINTFRLTHKSAEQTSLFYGTSFRSVQKNKVDFSKIHNPFFSDEGGTIITYTNSGVDSICSKFSLQIMHNVIDLISENYPKYKVAIITPFKDTVKTLQKEFYTENQQLDITVETIDRIQGMTVDYAIVYFPMNNIGFALSSNRFNVATSRSKSTTLIISDIDFNAMSSIPQISLSYIRTCNVIDFNKGEIIKNDKDILSDNSKTLNTYQDTITDISDDKKEIKPLIISNDVASLKICGKIDLTPFERPKKELSKTKKNYYVIDTNVFLDYPDIINKIDKKYPVILSAKVLDELDKMKINLDDEKKKTLKKH